MFDKAKLPILVLVLLVLISLFLTGSVFYFLQREREVNKALQGELSELKIKEENLKQELSAAKNTISKLELEVGEAKDAVDRLNIELQEEKSARQEALTQAEQLKADLEQQKSLRLDLEEKLTKAQEEAEKMQAQMTEISSKKTELEKKLSAGETQAVSNESVELGKVVVAPESKGKELTADITGKILVVNKEYNFAVVDLGKKDGVAVDSIFSVYHNNSYVGDIKVEKVQETMSAAGFVSAAIKDRINEGDTVIPKIK